jgi:hypothetical protein
MGRQRCASLEAAVGDKITFMGNIKADEIATGSGSKSCRRSYLNISAAATLPLSSFVSEAGAAHLHARGPKMPDPDPAPSRPPVTSSGGAVPGSSAQPRKAPSRGGKLAMQFVFIAIWLFWGYSVSKILVTSIQANQGQPESYLAVAAFLPAVLFTLLNVYWVSRKSSTLPLPALTAWIAGLTSNGQSTIGPAIGLVCFFLDPINPFTFAVIRFVLPRFRRSPPVADRCEPRQPGNGK